MIKLEKNEIYVHQLKKTQRAVDPPMAAQISFFDDYLPHGLFYPILQNKCPIKFCKQIFKSLFQSFNIPSNKKVLIESKSAK